MTPLKTSQGLSSPQNTRLTFWKTRGDVWCNQYFGGAAIGAAREVCVSLLADSAEENYSEKAWNRCCREVRRVVEKCCSEVRKEAFRRWEVLGPCMANHSRRNTLWVSRLTLCGKKNLARHALDPIFIYFHVEVNNLSHGKQLHEFLARQALLAS